MLFLSIIEGYANAEYNDVKGRDSQIPAFPSGGTGLLWQFRAAI